MAVKIVQNPEKPLPVEVVADAVKAIAQGVRQLRKGPLNDRALILLIQQAAPHISKYPTQPVTQKMVKCVLEGIDNLEREYLKPAKKST